MNMEKVVRAAEEAGVIIFDQKSKNGEFSIRGIQLGVIYLVKNFDCRATHVFLNSRIHEKAVNLFNEMKVDENDDVIKISSVFSYELVEDNSAAEISGRDNVSIVASINEDGSVNAAVYVEL